MPTVELSQELEFMRERAREDRTERIALEARLRNVETGLAAGLSELKADIKSLRSSMRLWLGLGGGLLCAGFSAVLTILLGR